MAGLDAHYSARDIEARILAALRAAGLSPEYRPRTNHIKSFTFGA